MPNPVFCDKCTKSGDCVFEEHARRIMENVDAVYNYIDHNIALYSDLLLNPAIDDDKGVILRSIEVPLKYTFTCDKYEENDEVVMYADGNPYVCVAAKDVDAKTYSTFAMPEGLIYDDWLNNKDKDCENIEGENE
jgi:hypothetical protein